MSRRSCVAEGSRNALPRHSLIQSSPDSIPSSNPFDEGIQANPVAESSTVSGSFDHHPSSLSSQVPSSAMFDTVSPSNNMSFTPLVWNSPLDVSDWASGISSGQSRQSDGTAASSTSSSSSSTRQPPRIRSFPRRNRRLFSPSRPTREGLTTSASARQGVNTQNSSIQGQTSGQTRDPAVSPDILQQHHFSFALDSSPRLELLDHSLQSFKRSFEEATGSSPAEGAETSPDVSMSDDPPSFIPSPPSFSSVSSAASLAAYRADPNVPSANFTSSNSLLQSPPVASTSSVALRHSPPPRSDGAGSTRVKRRRSRTDGSGENVGENEEPNAARPDNSRILSQAAPTLTLPPLSPLIATSARPDYPSVVQPFQADSASTRDTPETSSTESTISLAPPVMNAMSAIPRQDLTIDHTSSSRIASQAVRLERRSVSSGVRESMQEARNALNVAIREANELSRQVRELQQSQAETVLTLSPEEVSATATPVSVRRGLHRQFSLGALPTFNFDEEDNEDPTLEHEEDRAVSGAEASVRLPELAVRFRSRLPRRPNLHRNTTAVSPPEESPLNTPEAGEQRDAHTVYPGLAPSWRHSGAAQESTSQSSNTATGEFTRPQESPLDGLRLRFGDQAPQLSLDFENTPEVAMLNDEVEDSGTIEASSSNASFLDIPEPVPQIGVRRFAEDIADSFVEISSVSGATSVSQTGWHSDVEEANALRVARQLELSRRVRESFHGRIANGSSELDNQNQERSSTAAAAQPYTAVTNRPAPTRFPLVPPRVSLSSAQGNTSRRSFTDSNTTIHSSETSEGRSTASFWGELDTRSADPAHTQPTSRNSNMAAATVSNATISLQPGFSRRPGSLGRSNMRGPTRSSNEAWMRSQGIDLYDSLAQIGQSTTRGASRSSDAVTSASSGTSARTTSTSLLAPPPSPTRPPVRFTPVSAALRAPTPTPISSRPPSPSMPSRPSSVSATPLSATAVHSSTHPRSRHPRRHGLNPGLPLSQQSDHTSLLAGVQDTRLPTSSSAIRHAVSQDAGAARLGAVSSQSLSLTSTALSTQATRSSGTNQRFSSDNRTGSSGDTVQSQANTAASTQVTAMYNSRNDVTADPAPDWRTSLGFPVQGLSDARASRATTWRHALGLPAEDPSDADRPRARNWREALGLPADGSLDVRARRFSNWREALGAPVDSALDAVSPIREVVGHPAESATQSQTLDRTNSAIVTRRRSSAGPQLEALRPVSPLFRPLVHDRNQQISGRQRQNTLASDFSDDDAPPARSVFSTVSGLRVSSRAPASRSSDDGISGYRFRPSQRDRNTRLSQGSSRRITDWYHGYTDEMPPPRSETTSSNPEVPGVAPTATENGEDDGIALAMRRLHDVRQLLDEVERNMQRRQRANDTAHRARSDENAGASQSAVETSSHRLLRGISTYDAPPAGSHGRLSDPTASSAPERLPRLPSIRAPPVTSVSRGRHSEASGMLSGTTTNAFNIPLRSRQAAPQAGTHQPRVQPFDEIFAEVEAEFSQRDRSRAVGDRRSGPRSFLHTLSRDRRRESDANASSDQLRMGHNAPDPTTSALDALQSELAQLRRDAESNWPPARSGFALQDTTNTGLSDVAGLRARPITRLVNGSDRLGAAAIVPRPETASLGLQDGEQSSLPPFLRRSLRNRGQGVLAPREGALAAALNAQAWMDDFDMGLDLTYEGLLALSERIGPVVHRGASDTALASGLTIFKYASGSSAVGDGETRCAICLEDYEESDECARSNKCNHALHTSCLTAWLRQANSCPICRQAAV